MIMSKLKYYRSQFITNNLNLEMSKLVENYLLQEGIGKGVYGQVYRAIHQKSKNQFAVKVIPKSSFRSNPKLQQLAINEINILSSLKNDHIVRFIETLKTPNNFYFVYEYCNEGTIESLLQKKKLLSEPEALIFFKQLLEAFKELNKNNVMHRDLKPDNIFLLDGKIKLGDFGFCKMVQVNMAQTMLGSPIYMAPEILREEIYTTKADIWSLGVVLFQMLFGYCPFESSSISELINKLKEMDLEIPKHINPISQSTEILLRKMLVKDQFKRIQWVDLFDFVIDDKGQIVGGCKKQFAIQSLERYFLNENQQSTGKITIDSEKVQKSQSSLNFSETKKSTPNNTFIATQEWNTNFLPELPENKKVTSVQYIPPKPYHNENSLETVKQSENQFKSYENICDVKIDTPSLPKKEEKEKFGQKHKHWLDSILLVEEWISSVSNINDKIICLVLMILLNKIEEETSRYPEWTDVLIEEKRSLKQAISKLSKDRKYEKIANGEAQLLRFWKEQKSNYFERLIRAIYCMPDLSTSVEQILA